MRQVQVLAEHPELATVVADLRFSCESVDRAEATGVISAALYHELLERRTEVARRFLLQVVEAAGLSEYRNLSIYVQPDDFLVIADGRRSPVPDTGHEPPRPTGPRFMLPPNSFN